MIRYLGVPQIGFIGPGAQPEALLECCPRFVREGAVVEIDTRTGNLAAILEGPRCGEDTGRPARATRRRWCRRRWWWRWRRWRRPDDGGRSRRVTASATTTASAEAQRTNTNGCGEQSRASTGSGIKIGSCRHGIPQRMALSRAVGRLCRTRVHCNAQRCRIGSRACLYRPLFTRLPLQPAVRSFESDNQRPRAPLWRHRLPR